MTPTIRTRLPFCLVAMALLTACLAGQAAVAGGHCRHCGTAGGQPTPCGESGCGPRYWGAFHEQGECPDPCDICGQWRDCFGTGQTPELLAPWQLPPGRGFLTPQQVGYRSQGACADCAPRPRWCWW